MRAFRVGHLAMLAVGGVLGWLGSGAWASWRAAPHPAEPVIAGEVRLITGDAQQRGRVGTAGGRLEAGAVTVWWRPWGDMRGAVIVDGQLAGPLEPGRPWAGEVHDSLEVVEVPPASTVAAFLRESATWSTEGGVPPRGRMSRWSVDSSL